MVTATTATARVRQVLVLVLVLAPAPVPDQPLAGLVQAVALGDVRQPALTLRDSGTTTWTQGVAAAAAAAVVGVVVAVAVAPPAVAVAEAVSWQAATRRHTAGTAASARHG